MMKQLQFYKYTTWALLILNISMVAFFFLTAPQPHQGIKKGSGTTAIDILKLDQQQHQKFLNISKQHIQKMEEYDNQQRNLLQPYFKTLVQSENNLILDSLLHATQLLEREKIESTYQHFNEVKSILSPEQHVHFPRFVDHALSRILRKNKTNPPPKKKPK